jgi:inorganic phosphate transporter, PiT family
VASSIVIAWVVTLPAAAGISAAAYALAGLFA